MIKTIIFDFGDVFINLDKPATLKKFSELGKLPSTEKITALNELYEVGKISTKDFIGKIQHFFPNATAQQIIDAWNAILIDFPEFRLEFLQHLSSSRKYKLILLSNTNELHINWIKENVSFYEEFKSCFDAFYLSHEIQLRKPEVEVFNFILRKHQLSAHETLFIDDTKENTNAAASLGIHTWNNNPQREDITELFTLKSSLF
ncbi:HAD family hydrolase [Aquimarina algicola]|uniref:HAD family phosphatase n=1 Tax=Aquimarina algicola TaxID=2589995 RepID=A0A504J0G9_9FLAO|nr:HAD family phosphatase [Aquimarina algicola]TPN82095.1 HAD family phosphatase [Aquimarina algicola]